MSELETTHDTEFMRRLETPTNPAKAFRIWWPVIFRSCIYFLWPFLIGIGDALLKIQSHMETAAALQKVYIFPRFGFWGAVILAAASGLGALAGYMDGHRAAYSAKVNGEGFPPKTIVTSQPGTITVQSAKQVETVIK